MEYQSGNLFIRDMGSLTEAHEAGWKMEGHAHKFDHNTFILSGRYRCECLTPVFFSGGAPMLDSEGAQVLQMLYDVERGPGLPLFIDANHWHRFTCLEGPGRLICVYSHREPQTGGVIQQYNGWYGAYV